MSGVVCWITGLPQSGKSTLAARVAAALAPRRSCVVLDSDEVREALGAMEYGDDARAAFYATLARLAAMVARQGHVVLVAATAGRASYRALARELAPSYLEVWVRAELAECRERDRKGLYARADAGEAPTLPGPGVAYQAPDAPAVIASGGHDEQALAEIVAELEARAR